MRRGTILGPLILIALGVLFLLKNIRPELRIFETAIEYWPFLLIGWGVFRLIDVLMNYQRGSLVTGRPGVTGGEWVLIVVVTLIGAGVWGTQRFMRFGSDRIKIGGMDVFGETFDYPLEASKKCSAKAPRVILENLRGNARLVGVDTDTVAVTGRKMVRAIERTDADQANTKTPLEITETGEVITIRTNVDRAESERRVSTEIEIKVPKGSSVEARGRYGDFDISDVTGEVTVTSDNAGVRLQNLVSNVKINLRKSDIIRVISLKGDLDLKGGGRDIELEDIGGQVTINGSYSGETTVRNVAKPLRFVSEVTDFRVEKVPGDLQITLASLTGNNLVGPVRLTTKSKDVRLSDVTNQVEISVDRGDVELRQSKLPVSKIDIQVRNGDIELAMPQTAKLAMNASTERGNINNDFSSALKEETFGRGAKLTGSIGAGPDVRVSTNRGEVTIRKVVAGETATQADPPAPPRPPSAPRSAPPPRAEN